MNFNFMNIRPFYFLSLTIVLLCSCQSNERQAKSDETKKTAKKAWQLNTSGEPSVFAPEAIHTRQEFAISFTPDGREAYFTRTDTSGGLTIYRAEFDGEKWSEPRPASFSGTHRDADPFVTYDGERLFFMSFRPRPGSQTPVEAPDIWYVDRLENDWSEPVFLEVVNTGSGEGFPSVALNGNLYFPSDRQGNMDIFMAPYKNGSYVDPVRLDDQINSEASDSNPGISPDETLLFFYSGREGVIGAIDLFVSQKINGEWTKAMPLGDHINTKDADYCPYVSPDMNYLFFTRGTRTDTSFTNEIYSVAMDRALKGLGE